MASPASSAPARTAPGSRPPRTTSSRARAEAKPAVSVRRARSATPAATTAPIRHSRLKPFTIRHFRWWTRGLTLDNGKTLRLEDFQDAFVTDVFAGYRECWLIIPEGNAKTTLVSALALYHIEYTLDGRVPVAASSRDQAEILFGQADGLVVRSDLVGFTSLEGYRRIRFDAQRSRIQIMAADERTGDGAIPTLAITDELHRHRDLGLYRTWAGKLDKRNGQLVAISTRGEPFSEFETTLKKIRTQARDVHREETFTRAATRDLVLHEWGVPEGGNVEDIDLVKRANPLKAITKRSLHDKLVSPTTKMSHWKRLVCNLPERAENSAITEKEWADAKLDATIPIGVPIALGLDIAWKWDTTAATPYWWRDPDFRLLGPALILEPPRDGTMLDPRKIEVGLTKIHERNPIHTVVMDMSRAEQLAVWIVDTFGAKVLDRTQSNAMAVEDYDLFMEALRSGQLFHVGDPGLTSHVLNAIAVELPGGDSRFDRRAGGRRSSGQERRVIDGLTAASMVNTIMTLASREEPPPAEATGRVTYVDDDYIEQFVDD